MFERLAGVEVQCVLLEGGLTLFANDVLSDLFVNMKMDLIYGLHISSVIFCTVYQCMLFKKNTLMKM